MRKDLRPQETPIGRRVTAALLSVALILSALLTSIVSSESVRRALAEGSDNALERIFSLLHDSNADPQTFQEYEELANIAIAQELYEESLPYLTRCVELAQTEDPQVLASVWMRKGSICALLLRYDEAVECLDSALSIDPNMTLALMLRAQINIERGDLEHAVANLEAYLALEPGEAKTWIGLAQLYEALAKYDLARASYERAIALDEQDAASVLNRARNSYLTENYEEALADYDSYLDVAGDEGGTARFLRGVCLMQMSRYDEAIQDFLLALQDGYADAALCYEQISVCAYTLERHEDSIVYAGQALDAEGENTPYEALYQRMGISKMTLERYAEAVEDLTESITRNPALEGSFYYRGVCNLALEAYDEAISDFTGSIARGFLPQFCYYNRGVCHVQKMDYENALDDMEQTLKSGDDQGLITAARDILWQMAQYYIDNSEQPDALEDGT